MAVHAKSPISRFFVDSILSTTLSRIPIPSESI
ncbi:hypothetical protein V6Z11_A07G174700 [Gossypium hirsutum]